MNAVPLELGQWQGAEERRFVVVGAKTHHRGRTIMSVAYEN